MLLCCSCFRHIGYARPLLEYNCVVCYDTIYESIEELKRGLGS